MTFLVTQAVEGRGEVCDDCARLTSGVCWRHAPTPILSAPEPRCAKCAGTDIYTRFHFGNSTQFDAETPKTRLTYGREFWCNYREPGQTENEHLHRVCRTCGWKWTDPTAGAKP